MVLIKNELRSALNVDNLENSNFGLISLHRYKNNFFLMDSNFDLKSFHNYIISCGDLTPNILRIFIENKLNVKFLLTFGCCYHRMESTSNESYSFKNFPLSDYLKNLIKNEYADLKLSKFSLRLGAQQNM